MGTENDIVAIQERNRRVEQDKAWETSGTRRLVIAVATYVVAGVTLTLIKASNPWLTAFVPTLGWILSTLSLPPLKKWWISRRT